MAKINKTAYYASQVPTTYNSTPSNTYVDHKVVPKSYSNRVKLTPPSIKLDQEDLADQLGNLVQDTFQDLNDQEITDFCGRVAAFVDEYVKNHVTLPTLEEIVAFEKQQMFKETSYNHEQRMQAFKDRNYKMTVSNTSAPSEEYLK